MGIYDRDYIRNESSGGEFFSGPGGMCRRLVIVTVAVYAGQLLIPVLTRWLQLDGGLFQGQVWRLVTYAFAHDLQSPWHVLWNMYFLWILGQDLEQVYGPREFLWFYLGGAVFASLFYVVLGLVILQSQPPGTPYPAMLGASGAVSAVLVVMAMIYPTRQMLFFFIIPIEIRWLVFLNLIFDLHPVLMELGGGKVYSGIAHGAHLGGMLFGFLYRYFGWRLAAMVPGRSFQPSIRLKPRPRSNVKLYTPPEETVNLDAQVDAILQKISRDGEASLTDAERTLLKEASRRYKDRR